MTDEKLNQTPVNERNNRIETPGPRNPEPSHEDLGKQADSGGGLLGAQPGSHPDGFDEAERERVYQGLSDDAGQHTARPSAVQEDKFTDGKVAQDRDSTSDVQVTERVREKLRLHPLIDSGAIDVTTSDGHVTLTGNLTMQESVEEAEKCLASIPGIAGIQNDLRVAPIDDIIPS